MNLRDFKKDVEYFVGEFIDDCILFLMVNPKQDVEKINEIIDEAVDLYNDLKDKANAKVDTKKSTYFANLRNEMVVKVDALSEKLSEAISSSKKA